MVFALKIFVSAALIAFTSWLAGRKPILAGFIIALPLTSILAILFAYYEHRDMQKIDDFASSILVAVPLSLVFFVPFLLNRWMKLGFIPTFLMALAFLVLAYFFASMVLKIDLTK